MPRVVSHRERLRCHVRACECFDGGTRMFAGPSHDDACKIAEIAVAFRARDVWRIAAACVLLRFWALPNRTGLIRLYLPRESRHGLAQHLSIAFEVNSSKCRGFSSRWPQAARLLGTRTSTACRNVVEMLVASAFLRDDGGRRPSIRTERSALPAQDLHGLFGRLADQEPHLRVRRLHIERDPLLPHLL